MVKALHFQLILLAVLAFGACPSFAQDFRKEEKYVPYVQECELALTGNSALPTKTFNEDGFTLLSGAQPLTDQEIEAIYNVMSIYEGRGELSHNSQDHSFYIDALVEEDYFPPRYFNLPVARGGFLPSAQMPLAMGLKLRQHLLDIKKEAELAYGGPLEYSSAELRLVKEGETASSEFDQVYYHSDGLFARFIISYMGPTTFVKQRGATYSAPLRVPLLISGRSRRTPRFTLHGHPITHHKRFILVGTFVPAR